MKICENCGKPFEPDIRLDSRRTHKPKYCSVTCREEVFQAKRRERRKKDKTFQRGENGKYKRYALEMDCIVCDKHFASINQNKTCSPECAKKAIGHRESLMKTICLHCGKPVISNSRSLKWFCNESCRRKFRKLKNYKSIAEKIKRKVSADVAKSTLEELFDFIDVQTARYIKPS
jgi:hypothetical protein